MIDDALSVADDLGPNITPRFPLSQEKAFENLVETYGNLREVVVAPMDTKRAIREAARCDGIMVHSPDVPEVYNAEIATLREWIDLASFVLCEEIECSDGEPSRRKLYNDILGHIAEMERRGLTILSGVMADEKAGDRSLRIAIVSVTPKLTDPGAVKRSSIFVDRRLISSANMEFNDMD